MNMHTGFGKACEDVCIPQSPNKLGKGMNPVFLPQAMGKEQEWLALLAIVMQPVSEKENFELITVKLRLKVLALCHIRLVKKSWVNTCIY